MTKQKQQTDTLKSSRTPGPAAPADPTRHGGGKDEVLSCHARRRTAASGSQGLKHYG